MTIRHAQLQKNAVPINVIVVCIRWYVAYPLSYRYIEDVMEERSSPSTISTITRWVIRSLSLIEKLSQTYKRKVGVSWRMDETTANRDVAAAKRFFEKAMRENGAPDKVAMDKSGANKAAIDETNADRTIPIIVRQVKYLDNIVEQDHRAIKRVTRPMLGFKSFRAAGNVLAGVELMHMIRRASSRSMALLPCRLPTNFMRWQDYR